jgi:tRNA uridine 5-carboxymethylaminomethyl modification enzyme
MDDMRKINDVEEYITKNKLGREVLEQTEIQIKYAGYINKERANADKLNRLEGIRIPESFDYSKLKSLSYEALEKLQSIKPVTVSQASRISGVSPNDISVLLVYMGR